MAAVYWLILFVALAGIEALTVALTTIWFAGGALAAFFCARRGIAGEPLPLSPRGAAGFPKKCYRFFQKVLPLFPESPSAFSRKWRQFSSSLAGEYC